MVEYKVGDIFESGAEAIVNRTVGRVLFAPQY